MAHPLAFRDKYFYYPIGNTSAVSLTRDLATDGNVDVLILGCGDPRNVLYTLYCEPSAATRRIDFTCCDFDPAVLARNVLLFSMINDGVPAPTTLWNIFFHFMIDTGSHEVLMTQCQKLLQYSETMGRWAASPIGQFIRICSRHTLSELRSHWQLYVAFHQQPEHRIRAIRSQFTKVANARSKDMSSTAIRSAGPLMAHAFPTTAERFRSYWETGTTFGKGRQVASASLLNPTFVYSLGGEGCNVHYGTDPLIPFHTAAVFGNAKRKVAAEDVLADAKKQFDDWCTAAAGAIKDSRVVIRMSAGDAMAFCHALDHFNISGSLQNLIPVSQWLPTLLELDAGEYRERSAPTKFHSIETSNLIDHIGLLNVLIPAIPLLHADQGVLYTESVLFKSDDARKEFTSLLCMDMMTLTALVGLAPVDFFSGFTARSNTHELMGYEVMRKSATQFQQVTTWKAPSVYDSCDDDASSPSAFQPRQLGRLLYDVYHTIFEQEDSMKFHEMNKSNLLHAIAHSNLVHYSRETFVLLLRLVRSRLAIDEAQWKDVMARFFEFDEADRSMPMDTLNKHDLCAQLYRYNLHTARHSFQFPPRKIGRLAAWSSLPLLVRVILVVPREKLEVLKDSGTPPLLTYILGQVTMNNFNSVHAFFGKVFPAGNDSSPSVVLHRDVKGWQGEDPLLVSFLMPSVLLTELEAPQSMKIGLAVRSTPGTALLTKKLGLKLCVFEAPLMDKEHVYVLPGPSPMPLASPHAPAPRPSLALGHRQPTQVDLDEECELITSMTVRVDIHPEEAKSLLKSGVTPTISQISPCIMRLCLGTLRQDVLFPLPIVGTKNRLRVARKSSYIEMILPPSSISRPDGVKLNHFSLTRKVGGSLGLWNIHRVNPFILPKLDYRAKGLKEWLNPHIGSMMSARERTLRKQADDDALMNVKDTIHSILVSAAGIQNGPPRDVFMLIDTETNNCDTLLFVDCMRYDVGAHTVICDGYALPLTRHLLQQIERSFGRLINGANKASFGLSKRETSAWKQLLPVLAERCRTSWSHGDDCEYKLQGRIPLALEMEQDPLCGCGRGKDAAGMLKRDLWAPLAPHVTPIALSPLFAVSYLEPIGRDPEARRCFLCRQKSKSLCTGCKMVRYCSVACQKKDWKSHKRYCKV
ncbi:hypothetical protein BDZ89DRAFT_1098464 [Hymenopellis radicata]|nr:hypothetical protein BDZ89DRAFT_1098464 [Hymenopellis radicata]